jgi:hypothetical protein
MAVTDLVFIAFSGFNAEFAGFCVNKRRGAFENSRLCDFAALQKQKSARSARKGFSLFFHLPENP